MREFPGKNVPNASKALKKTNKRLLKKRQRREEKEELRKQQKNKKLAEKRKKKISELANYMIETYKELIEKMKENNDT